MLSCILWTSSFWCLWCGFNYYYFLIRNSNENNLIYLLLTRWRKNKWILIGIVYWASSGRLSSFVHHVVVNVKLDPPEKLFLLTIFSGFIGLCRVSIMQYMELLDKKLTGPGPEMSVHLGFLFFFLWHFFWQKTVKLHALQRSTLHKQTDFPPSCN